MKLTLYAHQTTEIEYPASNNSFALFAEQGTEKTLPMLLHILNLLKNGQITGALIICTKLTDIQNGKNSKAHYANSA